MLYVIYRGYNQKSYSLDIYYTYFLSRKKLFINYELL